MYERKQKPRHKRQPFPIKVKTVDGSIEWVPSRTNHTDACFNIKGRKFRDVLGGEIIDSYILEPGMDVLVFTGFKLDLYPGWVAEFKTKMDLVLNNGLSVLDSLGIMDSGHKSEACIMMINNGDESITLNSGDEIAQMIISKVPHVKLWHVEDK